MHRHKHLGNLAIDTILQLTVAIVCMFLLSLLCVATKNQLLEVRSSLTKQPPNKFATSPKLTPESKRKRIRNCDAFLPIDGV